MSTFLIADDSAQKTQFLLSILKHFKWEGNIVTVPSTEGAKKVIDEGDVAHAFIDYEMPTEEGPAVIRYLRAKNPEARIALVTSFSKAAYEDEAKEAGANAFVCTSDPQDQVIGAIKDLLLEWKTEHIA